MRRNDILLLGAVCIAALILYLANSFLFQDSGAYAVVTVDGEEFGRYSLEETQEIEIGDSNRLAIREHKADMTEADCPDRLCVKQKAVWKDGQTIVCLPNKIVVSIQGQEESGNLDAVIY